VTRVIFLRAAMQQISMFSQFIY